MKKKKLRPGTLALRNIKQHKKQYAAMVAGIILALIFATGLTYFAYCYRETMDAMVRDRIGSEDEIVMHTNEAFIQNARAQNIVETAGWAHLIGCIYPDSENGANGVAVAWLDDTAKELAAPTLLAGTWPEKDGEIAIEQAALVQMGLENAAPGDTVAVRLQVQGGNALLDKTVEKSYVLTGILRDKRANIYKYDTTIGSSKSDLPGAFVCAGAQTEPGGLEGLACYVTFTPGRKEQKFFKLSALAEQARQTQGDTAQCYLLQIDIISANMKTMEEEAMVSVQLWQVAGSAGVLLFAACAAILNAFNTNLQSRKKQIGMLRAVGATKRQIAQMYGTEVLVLALICVPASLVLSFAAVHGLLYAISGGYTFMPNVWMLLLCGLFGLLCVLLAAMIPLISATRISPMQAIRNIAATRKMTAKHIRTKKNYRLPNLLAARRTTFGKGRQVVVSIFLCIAVIVSGYAFSYAAYRLDAIRKEQNSYDYQLYSRDTGTAYGYINVRAEQKGFTESDRQAVLRSPYMADSAGIRVCNVDLPVDALSDYMNILMMNGMFFEIPDDVLQNAGTLNGENYKDLLFGQKTSDYSIYQSYLGGRDYVTATLVALDDEALQQMQNQVDTGEINTDRIDRGEEVVLLAPKQASLYIEERDDGSFSFETDTNDAPQDPVRRTIVTASRDSRFDSGNTLEMAFLTMDRAPSASTDAQDTDAWEPALTDRRATIGAVLNEGSDEAPAYSGITLFTSHSGMEALYGHLPYATLNFTLNKPCTAEIDRSVQSTLREITARVEGSDSVSVYENKQQQTSDTAGMAAILLGGVIVVLVFCGAIVNNTITADIRENRRELGTLRAVGASAKELSQAYIWQLLRMLGWGSAIGLGGFCLSYLAIWAFCRFKYGSGSMEFVFTPWVSILFCVLLFAVCSLNLYLKIKHETKNSIVDNIRELG